MSLVEVEYRILVTLSSADTSDWVKNALVKALDRDPVDAANDAEVLSLLLAWRAREIANRLR